MRAGIGLVKAYRYALGPILDGLAGTVPGAGRCKYHPTCSQYAIDAFRSHGVGRGAILAGWRLVRCNPWSHGGVDRIEDQRLFRRTA